MYALSRYGRVQGQTATTERQLVMLFEAAQSHMRTGIRELEEGRPLPGATALLSAAKVVQGLLTVLKPSVAPELCKNLGTVYGFVALRLNLAAAKKSIELAREAERVFAPVASAFITVASRGGQP